MREQIWHHSSGRHLALLSPGQCWSRPESGCNEGEEEKFSPTDNMPRPTICHQGPTHISKPLARASWRGELWPLLL